MLCSHDWIENTKTDIKFKLNKLGMLSLNFCEDDLGE